MLQARRATLADLDVVTAIVTLAFANDPLWARALARPDGRTDHHAAHWRLFVGGALRYPWTWIASDAGAVVAGTAEAVSVWIPPGAAELSPELEAQVEQLIHERLGPRAADYDEVLARFDAAHPRTEPHYYLSLLATHPDHRGKGIGMRLLGHDLALIDAEHMPAYLESTNPANDARYRGVGFEARGQFSFRGDGPVVTTMWRPAR